MSLIPPTDDAAINFFQSRQATWTTNAVAMGSTALAVTAMGTKTAAAQAKLTAAVAARAAAKTATAELRAAMRDMRRAGADIVRQVRTKASVDGSDTPYFLAQIPAPATPGPMPAPGQPTDFAATLNGDGSLNLRWRCANPAGAAGTMYTVARRAGLAGAFVPVGGSGTKSFVDATVPAGAATLTYQVQAVRSTALGPVAQFVVNFGVEGGADPGGEVVASVAAAAPPKLAA